MSSENERTTSQTPTGGTTTGVTTTRVTTTRVTTTRGSALKRLLLVAGGAVGVGVAGERMLTARDEPAAAVAPRTLVLHGHDWRVASPATRPGELPKHDDPAVPVGRLVDRDGNDLGSFSAAALPTLGAAVELHTFELGDGTLLGIGAAGMHDKPFAIVGGTGRFAGASGTYVARQSPRELGGDGTAEFTLTLAGGN